MRTIALLALLLTAGCATVVLGPDPDRQSNDAEATAGLGAVLQNSPLRAVDDTGLADAAQAQRPQDLDYGPDTGPTRSSRETLARAIDIVIGHTDMTEVRERTVYIPGLSGPPLPEAGRRAESRFIAARLAERVVSANGRVSFNRRESDFILFPWIQVLSGVTTFREYRFYYYPIYMHVEDQRPAWITVFLYDRQKKILTALEGDKTWQVKIDSYILGFIPVEWFLGF